MWISGQAVSTAERTEIQGIQNESERNKQRKKECYPQLIHILWIKTGTVDKF